MFLIVYIVIYNILYNWGVGVLRVLNIELFGSPKIIVTNHFVLNMLPQGLVYVLVVM